MNAITEAIVTMYSIVVDCSQLFEQSFKVVTSLQEDPNIQLLDMESCELQ